MSRTLLALTALAGIGSVALADVVVDSPNGFVLRSGNDITLAGGVQVQGSIGAINNVTLGWDSFASKVEIGDENRTWSDPNVPLWAVPHGSNVNLGWAETRTLTAGAYGAFTSNSSTTLNLAGPGNYRFTNFQLGWNGNVVADTSAGDVYLYVNGSISAADATRFQATGTGKLFLIALGNMSFGYQSNIQAAVYSGGDLNFGGAALLNGFAYAGGDITAGYGSTFNFVPVPAPGAMALVALAGTIAGRRRRRV